MTLFITSILMLADRALWQHLGDGFKQRESQVTTDVLLATACILIAVLAILMVLQRIARKQSDGQVYDDPRRLFRELCDVHGLNRTQRKLLHRLAQQSCLETPALLFMKPDSFASEALRGELVRHADEVTQLREKLFGGGSLVE